MTGMESDAPAPRGTVRLNRLQGDGSATLDRKAEQSAPVVLKSAGARYYASAQPRWQDNADIL